MVYDKVVCERWCGDRVVCDKVVCERWYVKNGVTKWCVKDGVCDKVV